MTTQLHQQRAALQSQLDSIDLAAMHQAIADAEAAADDYAQANTHRRALPDVMLEMSRLRGAIDQAQREQQASERDVHRLVLALTRADAMLNAGQRIDDTEAAIDPARDAVDSAQTALSSATGVLAEIDSLLTAERDAHAQRSRQATDELLAAVRAGQSPKRVKADTGTLDTLEHAHASAQAAVTEAGAVLTDAQANLDAALHDCKVAQTGATAYALHLAAHAYAETLVAHEDSCWSCRAHFDAPDVEQLVIDLRRETETVGDPGTGPSPTRGAEAR